MIWYYIAVQNNTKLCQSDNYRKYLQHTPEKADSQTLLQAPWKILLGRDATEAGDTRWDALQVKDRSFSYAIFVKSAANDSDGVLM